MSIRTVVISLIVALALGGVSWYLLSRPEHSAAPGAIQPGAQLIDLDPAAVKAVRIVAPDGDEQVIERGMEPGLWYVRLNGGKPSDQRWPLQLSAVQGLLRRFAETRAIAEPAKDDLANGIGREPTSVFIELDNGGVHALHFAARTLGDRGLVEVEPFASSSRAGADASNTVNRLRATLAVVDSNLHKVLRTPGPKGWRDTRVFTGLGPDVSRISLSNVDRNVRLGKVNGTWALVEPVAVAADAESIRKLISFIGELTVEQFLDEQQPPSDTTGLDAPIVTITIESDRSIIDEGVGATSGLLKTRTEIRTLWIGKPDDGTMQRRFASLAGGGPVFTIPSSALSQEMFMPARYISPRVIDTPVGDIGGVILEPASGVAAVAPSPVASPDGSAAQPAAPFPTRVFKRSLNSWLEVVGGKETPLDEESARYVNELLSFLAGEAPRSIELAHPVGWTEKGTINLLSLGGSPLAVVTIGAAGDGALGAKATDAKNRPVFRVFAPGRSPAIFAPLAADAKRRADELGGNKPKTDEKEIMK